MHWPFEALATPLQVKHSVWVLSAILFWDEQDAQLKIGLNDYKNEAPLPAVHLQAAEVDS